MKKLFVALLAFAGMVDFAFPGFAQEVLQTGGHPMPDEWIDKATGHLIVRLSRREGNNHVFYFHNNPFLPVGQESLKSPDKKGYEMVFYGSAGPHEQLFVVNLPDPQAGMQDYKVEQLTHHAGRISGEIVGRKHREAYYQCKDSVFAVNIDSHKERLVYVFPPDFKGHIAALNADETLLAGVWSKPQPRRIKLYPHSSSFDSSYSKGSPFERIYEAHIPHVLFTINLKTKALKKIDSEDNWLNHEQFSPIDPDLLLYAHEGPWDRVDRTWIINVKTGRKRLLHKRTVPGEINGHEWWAPDGRSVWFDLQIPMGVTFYVAGVDLKSGVEKRYAIKRNEWSVHFTCTADEKLFAGDGGDSLQVAHAKDGKWIYLFHPDGDSLRAERLVDMRNHIYQKVGGIEPNLHFSPDNKWLVFTGNFEGKDEIYAVKVEKSK